MDKKFSTRLRFSLDLRNKRPVDLANDTGLSQALISQYLNDKFEPKNDKIAIIAEYLNVSPIFLMGWSDEVGSYRDDLVQIDGVEKFQGDEQGYLNWLNSYDDDDFEKRYGKKAPDTDNYYGDHQANLDHLADKPELLHIYNDIYESQTLQLLFDKTQDLTPEDLEMVLTIISGIRKERGLD